MSSLHFYAHALHSSACQCETSKNTCTLAAIKVGILEGKYYSMHGPCLGLDWGESTKTCADDAGEGENKMDCLFLDMMPGLLIA